MAEGDVVLVTGGAGFLGQHIVHLLQEKTSVREIRVFDIRAYRNNMGGFINYRSNSTCGSKRICAGL